MIDRVCERQAERKTESVLSTMGGEGGGWRPIGQYQVILDTSYTPMQPASYSFVHSCICSLIYKTYNRMVGSVHSLIDAN